jgi:phage tail-like protein
MFTTLEGQLRDLRRLVDPNTIDAQYLPWLAGWVGAVVEPDWEAARQRLLVRHAAQLFTRRGTQRGLIEAIRLATHPCPTDAIFEPGVGDAFDVRVVESFRIRSVAGVVFGDASDPAGPAYASTAGAWELGDGRSELERRWRRFLDVRYGAPGTSLTSAVASAWSWAESAIGTPPTFPTRTPVTAVAADDWHAFVRSELAVTYPDIGSADTPVFREFLAQRYPRFDDYRTAWSLPAPAAPGDFSTVALPSILPADGAPLEDWIVFVSSIVGIRRAAHRATVLVPIRFEDSDEVRDQRLGRVRRVVEVHRPAHTLVEVAPYWAACRVGEARVGLETIVGEGSRYVDLVLGADRLARAITPGGTTWRFDDRVVVGRDRIDRSAEPAGTGGSR